MSTRSGRFTGEGTPSNQRMGRRQTYRSRSWRRATLSDRKPPPTGVVNGPLMPMRYSLKTSIVSCGSQSPVSLKAFSPARTSFQEMDLPYFFAAGVEDQLGGRPDVDAGAVAFDERDDGLVGNGQGAVLRHGDLVGHDQSLPATPGGGVRRAPATDDHVFEVRARMGTR